MSWTSYNQIFSMGVTKNIIGAAIEEGDFIPRRTEMEIRVDESIDPNANLRMRVLRSKDKPGTFTLVEAKPEALRKARAEGRSFDWIEVNETDGLSAEQVGQLISEELSS